MSEKIDDVSYKSMTTKVQCKHAITSTDISTGRPLQTTGIDTVDMICGSRSAFCYVSNKYFSCMWINPNRKLSSISEKKKDVKSQPFSEVCIQGVSNYLLDNQAVLDGMKDALDTSYWTEY